MQEHFQFVKHYQRSTFDNIKKYLKEGNYVAAINCWQHSYYPISVEKFLACNETETNRELLDSIKDILSSVEHSVNKIEEHLREESSLWQEMMEAGAHHSHPRHQMADKILCVRNWIDNHFSARKIDSGAVFAALTNQANKCRNFKRD
jgi:hypothetical protein